MSDFGGPEAWAERYTRDLLERMERELGPLDVRVRREEAMRQHPSVMREDPPCSLNP